MPFRTMLISAVAFCVLLAFGGSLLNPFTWIMSAVLAGIF